MREGICGGLIRDNNRIWITGFSKKVELCSVLVVELWGEGVVKRLGVTDVEISVDSIEVVNEINNHKAKKPIGRTLKRNIREYIETDWDIEL